MKQKKILFISPVGEFYGGGERSGFEFCKFLEKHNYKVITAIPKTSQTYKETLDQSNMEYRLMNCNDFECQVMQGNQVFPGVVSQLMDIISQKKIDIVITNLYSQAGPVAAILSGIPNISMDRGQAYTDTFFPDFMVKFSDVVVVNSSGLKGVYKEKYNIDTPVVYSYTSTPKVGLDSSIKEQRIVCVSRISPEKNLLEVLEAVKILKNNGHDRKVLFIGPVPGPTEERYKAELQSYAKKNGLDDNVVWLGDQQNPWSLVGERDIYLNTSIKESVGRSNIEAIKLGAPVVIADIPGHKDIIDKIGATSYSLGEPRELADKIRYIIDNYQEAKSKAANGREKAEEWVSEYGCSREILPALQSLGEITDIRPDLIFNHILDKVNELTVSLQNSQNRDNRHSIEIESRDREIASYLGIKRSARLFAGNIKRRVQRSLRIARD